MLNKNGYRKLARFDYAPVANLAPDIDALAELCGVDRNTVVRWKRQPNGLNERQADHIAIAMGLHPSYLWPDWWQGVEYKQVSDDRYTPVLQLPLPLAMEAT